MKNLCFGIITVVIVLYFTGTMTAPSRKSSILLNSECQWNGYHLTNCSFADKHDMPLAIPQTAATMDISLFRVLLQPPVKTEEWNIKHLELSNNLIWKITLHPLTHLHALEILNLSNNAIHSISLDLPSPVSGEKHHRSKLTNGLPSLKFLILRKNKLTGIPKGLWKLKSLQSLDLSLNGISQIGLFDFYNCLHLRNLYLKSNEIFRIHPKAFKNLKKLQVVDLSNNALSTILPMMNLALELPHLEVDLTDNQWHCDSSVLAFQNVISESWRRKWNMICNNPIENEAAYWWIPQSRISRERHLPHTKPSHMTSLRMSRAQRPLEVLPVTSPTLSKEEPASSDAREKQKQLPRPVRRPRDVQTHKEKEEASQDLILAICLSVFITFFVAFCLGAFARPYIDRLWQRRCQNKSSSSDNAYSNEGFYDEVEATGNIQQQHPKTDLHQSVHDPKLCEKQNPFGEIQTSLDTVSTADKVLGISRKEADRWQKKEQHGANTGARNRRQNTYPDDSVAHSSLHGQPSANSHVLTPVAQVHSYRNDIFEEPLYDTVAQEETVSEHSLGISGRLHTASKSTLNNPDEIDPPLSRDIMASPPIRLTYTKEQRPGEKEARGYTKQLPSELSREMEASTYINSVSVQQQRPERTSEEEPSLPYSTVTLNELADTGPSPLVCPQGWQSDPHVTPTNEEPKDKQALDTQYELDTSYDSDEGSLFTLSSTSSEDARQVTEEEHNKDHDRASESPQENSGVRMGSVMTLENHENNTIFQKILRKSENQEDHSEKPLASRSDSDLCETHPEGASNTHKFEAPLSFPVSQDKSPCSDESSGMFTYGSVTALHSESVQWHYSLKDLVFPDMSISSQTPSPHSAEIPSDSDKRTCHERDSDICKYEPFIQGIDTTQNDILFEITTWENTRPSSDSKGGSETSNPRNADADEDCDSRKDMSLTQLLLSYGEGTCSSV